MSPHKLPHPLPPALAELIAERFRALGDPMRVRLLDQLRDGPATVNELTLSTGSSQQNTSKHLRVMLAAGLVRRRQDGNFARYAIADEDVLVMCEHVCGGVRRQLSDLDSLLGGAA